MTQCEKIMRHMQDHGSITPVEAMSDLKRSGCYRAYYRGYYQAYYRQQDKKRQDKTRQRQNKTPLPLRGVLERSGIAIRSKQTEGKNRYGERVRYSVYSLEVAG